MRSIGGGRGIQRFNLAILELSKFCLFGGRGFNIREIGGGGIQRFDRGGCADTEIVKLLNCVGRDLASAN